VAITDETIGISQLLGAHSWAVLQSLCLWFLGWQYNSLVGSTVGSINSLVSSIVWLTVYFDWLPIHINGCLFWLFISLFHWQSAWLAG